MTSNATSTDFVVFDAIFDLYWLLVSTYWSFQYLSSDHRLVLIDLRRREPPLYSLCFSLFSSSAHVRHALGDWDMKLALGLPVSNVLTGSCVGHTWIDTSVTVVRCMTQCSVRLRWRHFFSRVHVDSSYVTSTSPHLATSVQTHSFPFLALTLTLV